MALDFEHARSRGVHAGRSEFQAAGARIGIELDRHAGGDGPAGGSREFRGVLGRLS